MEVVSFIGLGGMGGAMARRIAERVPLLVFDRDPSRATAITGKAVTSADSAAAAVRPGGVVITMLPDDAAVLDVASGADGAAARLGNGGVHVNMSTVSPELSRRLAGLYHERGGGYVAAPVWGRPDMAGTGGLLCAVAGPTAAKLRARPYLEALAARVEDFGEEAAAANVVKVLGNFLVAAAIEALGESMAVAEKHGLNRAAVVELLVGTLFDCPVYRTYGPLVSAQAAGPAGFSAVLGRKDLDLVRRVASEVDVPVPFANVIENRLIATIARGRAAEDWSSLSWIAAEDAGLQRPVGS